MSGLSGIWVYLAASPLTWLGVTLVAFVLAMRIGAFLGNSPLANSVLVSAALIIPALLVTRTPYQIYFEGAQFVHFLLGPATVSLAVPLYRNRDAVKRSRLPIVVALIAGALTAIGSALAIAALFGAPPDVLASIAPKSVSAPIAMELANGIGGIPSLAAVLVILTGITGAVIVTPLMNALGITDYRARGFAVGLAAHGIGTARALQVSDVAGAFSGIAMALNGAFTAALIVGVMQLL
ncbi:LrgB family protein [Devosia chinhatensis]|uniref:Membrane protein n=1 Tax=Devosia chinhatensis TaxID=429727 RepID=A0A0F5FMY3_9HYPH|nr:LrgB family protein [Devosia chinhatensis]KKB10249.1 membrane protein [Devosia chinhatensis]